MFIGVYGWTNGEIVVMNQLSQQSLTAVFRGDKTFTSTLDGSTRYYWLDLPDDFDNSTPTPLVIFLHGYGGDRYDYSTEPSYQSLRLAFQTNNWIVAAVDCRKIGGYYNWYIEPSRRDITDVINAIKNEYNIDYNHIHTLGTSMGGVGALQYAMFNTEVIASAVDIMGVSNFTQFYIETSLYKDSLETAFGGTPTQVPAVYVNESALGNEQRFSQLPVMLLHGTADTVVSVSHSRNLNQSLSAFGYTVNYIEVPGINHNDESLINSREMEILNWLQSHSLVEYTLTINVIGDGSVDVNPAGPYYYGDVVSLTAVPATGWRFSVWSGAVSGSVNPATVNMTGNLTAVATFTQSPTPTPTPTPVPTPTPTPVSTPTPTPVPTPTQAPTPSPTPEPFSLPVEALYAVAVVVVVIVAIAAWMLLRRKS